jgi:hypothetical protein
LDHQLCALLDSLHRMGEVLDDKLSQGNCCRVRGSARSPV